MLVGRGSESNSDSALGPASGHGLHQLFDAVLPEDPGVHALRDSGRADGQLAKLFRLQAPGLAKREAWMFGHFLRLSNRCPMT